MTYVLTFQASTHDKPVVRSFDSLEEAQELEQEARKDVEEKRLTWKIAPTIRPEQ